MISRYGLDNFLIMIVISIILILVSLFVVKCWGAYVLFVIGMILCMFAFWFFRDPERNISQQALSDNSIILSPADGKVLEIRKVDDDKFINENSYQISIFLSPLDVHVNRIPVSGVVKYFKYFPGDYLIAYHPKSSLLNEQTHIGVENEHGKVLFKQIVGIVARRLVWDIKEGDTVKVGNRFGMMKFGSRMDIIVKEGTQILINVGDKVVAGETIIAKLQ